MGRHTGKEGSQFKREEGEDDFGCEAVSFTFVYVVTMLNVNIVPSADVCWRRRRRKKRKLPRLLRVHSTFSRSCYFVLSRFSDVQRPVYHLFYQPPTQSATAVSLKSRVVYATGSSI